MPYMLVRHKVEDFAKWKKVLDSQTENHIKAGMTIKHVWRNDADPNDIFFLFHLRSMEEAQDYLNTPQPGVAEEAGVVGVPEIYFLK
ncbi:MAG: hypothetical protein L0Y74_04160 [candidate division Zixibacteria bacterium]|nr:hypothetical protein [candidate division Zixibacteria bacterium]